MSDNFESDPFVSPCDDCHHRGTMKCRRCKHRDKYPFNYPYPGIRPLWIWAPEWNAPTITCSSTGVKCSKTRKS